MEEEKLLQIDVEEIIKTKSASTYKKIPKVVIRYLKKILHQDEINEFLKIQKGIIDLKFVEESIKFVGINLVMDGFENIPNAGKFIFVANHPLGGAESLLMMKTVSQKYKEMFFIVNDLLMFLTPLKNIFIPVNKLGGQSRKHAELINQAYFSEKQILYFPAGLCSRKIKGKIVDLEWQKNFIIKAIESQRDIVPIYIDGKNSDFFYNLAKLRKFLGIKFNIEMLFLVNEMFKQRGKTVTIRIGKPISFTEFNNSKTPIQWAQVVKDRVYKIK
ncbi:MAG: glycerol acyltransferase [Bacteroidales bacterium]|jgi:putative hemolysin|nr:glycerol acyltransferase [Bacteroidales bacterium]